MKMKSPLLILIIALLLPFSAMAQKPAAKKKSQPARPAKNPACADLETQSGMNRCALSKYQKADEELNKIYPQTMEKLSPEHMQKLKTAQLAWIQFRDAHCDCEIFFYEGGTIQPLIKYSCLETETKARIKQLKSLAEAVDH